MVDPSCKKKGPATDHRFANPLAQEVSRAFIPPCTCRDFSPQAAALGPALAAQTGTLATDPRTAIYLDTCTNSWTLVKCIKVVKYNSSTLDGRRRRDGSRFSELRSIRLATPVPVQHDPNTRIGIPEKFDSGQLKRLLDLFDRFEMRRDPAVQSLQSTHGRNRNPGIDGELVLLPSDQRSCCSNLTRDYKHRSPCPRIRQQLSLPILGRRPLPSSLATSRSSDEPTW
jgi:hypothetical protein